MSLVHTLSAVVLGAGVGAYFAGRSIKEGSPPKDVAYFSGIMAALGSAFVVWQLALASMIGDVSSYLLPSLETKSQRNFLFYYGAISAALAAFVTAGLALVIRGRDGS